MIEYHAFWKQLRERHLWIVDGAVFLTLAALVLYTASKHEPWADEADTWLEVRDIPWFRLVFSELRYDGHLPLWHAVVWVPMHVLHMPYDYFVYIGSTCAIAGLAVLIFLAPFPRPLRYIIAASFFFLYQYAAVARPYVLVPLLGFLAAHFYRQGLSRITAFAIAIAILIQDSSYSTVIGCTFAAFYGFQLARCWKEILPGDRKRIFRAAALITMSVIFAVVVLIPRQDSSLVAGAIGKTLQRHVQLVGEGFVGAFADSAMVAIPLVLLAGVWAYQRSGLLLLIMSVGGTSLEYGFLQGYGHHQGLITIALVVSLWAVWPRKEQLEGMPRERRWLHQALVVALILAFGWQCSWSYHAIRNDWAGPYTGARDAALYLKSAGADKLGCNGYTFWAVAVQPYFDHNIFLNYGGPNAPAAYHFATGFDKRAARLTQWDAQNGPPFIVVAPEMTLPEATAMIEQFRDVNYVLVHYSDGTRFFKNQLGTHSPYFIFEKIDFALSKQK
jgi:hypothetical protein